MMAGEQSYRAYASEDAIEFLQRAEVALPDAASENIRFRLYERLGTSFTRMRRSDVALRFYQPAIQCAPNSVARATAYLGIARCHQIRSDYASATANYDLVLKEFKKRRPTTLGAIVRIPMLTARIFLMPIRWQQARDQQKLTRGALQSSGYAD